MSFVSHQPEKLNTTTSFSDRSLLIVDSEGFYKLGEFKKWKAADVLSIFGKSEAPFGEALKRGFGDRNLEQLRSGLA